MSLTDEQIELNAINDEPEDWDDLSHRNTWRQGYVIGYRAAESAATTPLMERIKELKEMNAQLREQNTAVDKACADLEAHVEQLERELEALRKDAERYRWLKSQPERCPERGPDLSFWENCSGKAIRYDEADAAIDSAMKD
jgi:chromosome segregation ATPase